MEFLRVKLLTETSIVPRRATCGSAGYDISSNISMIVPVNSRALVGTGISIEIPPQYYARIAPRSGLAVRGIDIVGGVVDSDYRGEVKVLLANNSDTDFSINLGERIAQLILEKIITPDIEIIKEHEKTERGAKGFGSSGQDTYFTDDKVCGYTGLSDLVVPSER